MELNEDLLKQINRKYDPSSMVRLRYRNLDLVLQTDRDGNATLMFLGRADEQGIIRGDRFRRVLVLDREGKVIRDHWERKGKAS